MIKHIIAGAKRAVGLHRPGRELVILPDDTFLVSYPKSGNTWTRFLIANLLSPDRPADFKSINRLVPDPAADSKRQFERMPRPRVIKSHFCFDPRYPRVIYVVRDPRDVVISEYHYQRKTRRIDDQYPLAEYVPRFIRGETYPENGSWGEHVTSWINVRAGSRKLLLLHYERMLADTVTELARIASFLNVSADSERLKRVAELSSVERMRSLEKKQSSASSLTKSSRQDVAFVRAARSGGWRSELPAALAAQIEQAWGPMMRQLQYECVFSTEQRPSDAAEFNLSQSSR